MVFSSSIEYFFFVLFLLNFWVLLCNQMTRKQWQQREWERKRKSRFVTSGGIFQYSHRHRPVFNSQSSFFGTFLIVEYMSLFIMMTNEYFQWWNIEYDEDGCARVCGCVPTERDTFTLNLLESHINRLNGIYFCLDKFNQFILLMKFIYSLSIFNPFRKIIILVWSFFIGSEFHWNIQVINYKFEREICWRALNFSVRCAQNEWRCIFDRPPAIIKYP